MQGYFIGRAKKGAQTVTEFESCAKREKRCNVESARVAAASLRLAAGAGGC
jgi:hypothetical protein